MRSIGNIINRVAQRIWSDHTMILLEYIPKTNENVDLMNHFEFANNENIRDILSFEDESYLKTYQRMLKDGEIGILGYLDQVCVFRHWIQMKGCIYHERRNILVLDEQSCYSHYVYCSETARKHGLHSESIQLIKNKFPDHKIYTLVNAHNNNSMKNYTSAAFKPIKRINTKMRLFCRTVSIHDLLDSE